MQLDTFFVRLLGKMFDNDPFVFFMKIEGEIWETGVKFHISVDN